MAALGGCSDEGERPGPGSGGSSSGTGGTGEQGGAGGNGGTGGTGGTAGMGGAGGDAGAGGMGGSGGQGGQGGSGGMGGSGGGAQLVEVQILGINDFHGNLEPPSGSGGQIVLPDSTKVFAGGAAYMAVHMAALRAQNPNTVAVSAGDLIGASPLISALFHDEPTIEAMNLMGLDINGVGNHEFDDGATELLRMQSGGCHPVDGCADGTPFPGATFKFLSANVVVDKNTGKTLFPRYDIREFDGVKVAFIGMTLEGTPDIVTPTGIAGITFMDEVETVNKIVPELQAQGVEAITVVLHEGGMPTGAYDACPGISGPIVEIATNMSDAVDVIVSGHTHQAYNCTIAGKLVTSAASQGRLITDIDLTIDKATGHVVDKKAKNTIVTRDVSDPMVEMFVTNYKNLAAPLANKQVGTITADFLRPLPPSKPVLSAPGALIADSQLEATKPANLGGSQVAFLNPGGVRADLVYKASGAEPTDGIVTYGEIFTVQPFGNSLVVMTLTGDQIKAFLEQQFSMDAMGNTQTNLLQVSEGFTYSYSLSAPIGSKVDFASIKINGTPIVGNATYRVTVNSFLAAGGDGYSVLVQGTERLGGAVDLEALQGYFAKHSPVSPPALDRITVLP
ncbi:bifunctional metallophosphatase/5'-nucleotidase [Polyangium aurulentum]|uniref:bifunctional metallophosphatase/5'-nucleotidase n=1 Tax=Polyangium aurulentum TaxID=2567896 RepID=UPI001F2D0F28|nr:bifunctional metallophosphatase/5'-nucleotidase [Polyangium aurulentum]